jgi:hypothetical protein
LGDALPLREGDAPDLRTLAICICMCVAHCA